MSDSERPSRRDLFRGRLLHDLGESLADELRSETDRRAHERVLASDLPARVRRVGALHRPPGAAPEPAFLAGCTRCGDCAEACPISAIRPLEEPHAAANTPVIDAMEQPCVMCDGLSCIDVCEPRVLSREHPLKMAEARVLPSACLAFRGVSCRSCYQRCPVPGAFVVEALRPRIVQDVCTGCGVCLQACPATQPAILLEPLSPRP